MSSIISFLQGLIQCHNIPFVILSNNQQGGSLLHRNSPTGAESNGVTLLMPHLLLLVNNLIALISRFSSTKVRKKERKGRIQSEVSNFRTLGC